MAGNSGFYQRAELLGTVQDSLRAGDSVSLVGERKAGKTSFLNYLTTNLSLDEFIPVFVDTQRIMPRTDQIFLGTLIKKAADAINRTKAADTRHSEIEATVAQNAGLQAYLDVVLELLNERFGEEELKEFCFNLGVDYENLAAAGKVNKARELIQFMRHRDRLTDMVLVGRSKRPDIPWADVPPQLRLGVKQNLASRPQTLQAAADEVYQLFEDELNTLRNELPPAQNGQTRRLVWLLDEIETLQGYPNSELFIFLRPYAQSDPDFRIVAGGYDVLYTLSTQSKWSPFYNAFRHTRLTGQSMKKRQRYSSKNMILTSFLDISGKRTQRHASRCFYLSWRPNQTWIPIRKLKNSY